LYDDTGDLAIASIGGSNFSVRSYKRDLEHNLYMVTDCPQFKEELEEERKGLFAYGAKVTTDELRTKDLKFSFPTKILSRVFKSYM
jgi:phosphatidylserine/phosphatidylglycerophosphate/cardiolipin synthase-like enzyme